jgi:hypothetical protein
MRRVNRWLQKKNACQSHDGCVIVCICKTKQAIDADVAAPQTGGNIQ